VCSLFLPLRILPEGGQNSSLVQLGPQLGSKLLCSALLVQRKIKAVSVMVFFGEVEMAVHATTAGSAMRDPLRHDKNKE
jgi:hypothetical protein